LLRARRTQQPLGLQLGSPATRYHNAWPEAVATCASLVFSESTNKAAISAKTRGPWTRDPQIARLEAVLFLAKQPLSSRKLAQLAGLADGTEARTLIRRINRWYDESGSAFRAEEVAGGFQLLSRPKFGAWLRRLYQSPVETRLSAPALETLAVVAYRQPVLRAQIEAIRGVDCGEILRQLMERDLLRISGRSEDLGRPFLYGTTKRFLQVFGLRHLDDLPRAEFLRFRAFDSTVPDTITINAAPTTLEHAVATTAETTLSDEDEEDPK
jgi:segregation and condensation protein B